MLYDTMLWTSKLEISVDNDNIDFNGILSLVDHLRFEGKYYSKFDHKFTGLNKDSVLYKLARYEELHDDELNSFISYDSPNLDPTGMMKGYALTLFKGCFSNLGNISYKINFGGDILARNWTRELLVIESEKDKFIDSGKELEGDFCVFTSSNKSSRGNHIINKDGKQLTVTFYSNDIDHLIRSDMYATQLVSGNVTINRPLGDVIYT